MGDSQGQASFAASLPGDNLPVQPMSGVVDAELQHDQPGKGAITFVVPDRAASELHP